MVSWYGGHGTGGWAMVLMMISMALFWALVVVGTIVLVRHLIGTGRAPAPGATPEQMVGARFARGEIDEQEYRQIRDALREPRPVAVPR